MSHVTINVHSEAIDVPLKGLCYVITLRYDTILHKAINDMIYTIRCEDTIPTNFLDGTKTTNLRVPRHFINK